MEQNLMGLYRSLSFVLESPVLFKLDKLHKRLKNPQKIVKNHNYRVYTQKPGKKA